MADQSLGNTFWAKSFTTWALSFVSTTRLLQKEIESNIFVLCTFLTSLSHRSLHYLEDAAKPTTRIFMWLSGQHQRLALKSVTFLSPFLKERVQPKASPIWKINKRPFFILLTKQGRLGRWVRSYELRWLILRIIFSCKWNFLVLK